MKARIRTLAVVLAAAAALGACADVERYDAAADIRSLLQAIRDGDQAGFDAHVDRDALRNELRARLIEAAARRADDHPGLAALGAALARPVADAAAGALVQPDVFRAVADQAGYRPDRPLPPAAEIAAGLRRIDGGRVCVPRSHAGPCLFVFADENGSWRLVSFEGALEDLVSGRRR